MSQSTSPTIIKWIIAMYPQLPFLDFISDTFAEDSELVIWLFNSGDAIFISYHWFDRA